MKVNYHLPDTKRSSLVVLLFMVCIILIIGIPDTPISSVVKIAWAKVIATIPVGDGPIGIAFNADNGDMYVPNHDSDKVFVIDGQTNTLIGSPIRLDGLPVGIAFNANSGNMYVTNLRSNNVSVICPLAATSISCF